MRMVFVLLFALSFSSSAFAELVCSKQLKGQALQFRFEYGFYSVDVKKAGTVAELSAASAVTQKLSGDFGFGEVCFRNIETDQFTFSATQSCDAIYFTIKPSPKKYVMRDCDDDEWRGDY